MANSRRSADDWLTRAETPRNPAPDMTATIQAADGITYQVLTAKPYIHNGVSRISYTVKRPRGRRTYVVIGYENGTFSTAV